MADYWTVIAPASGLRTLAALIESGKVSSEVIAGKSPTQVALDLRIVALTVEAIAAAHSVKLNEKHANQSAG